MKESMRNDAGKVGVDSVECDLAELLSMMYVQVMSRSAELISDPVLCDMFCK
jgi:L-fucose isomerase-like protein